MTDSQADGGYGKCGAKTRSGGNCARPAGWGTPTPSVGNCKLHLGCTPTHQRAASAELARRACVNLGIQIHTTPEDALLDELLEAAGNVKAYREHLKTLPAVYGPLYHVSGIATGEAKPHVAVVMYNQERDRLAKVATEMLRLNLDDRLVRVAERQAELVVEAVKGILRDLGVADHPEAAASVRRHLTLVAGEAA